MKLEGIHHITCITEDAQRNVDFYAGVMGLRLVKKTVNQDNPTVYHLFFGDEGGDPGLDLTFFEYPGVPPGRAGAGMVHRILWRVASPEALAFWERRLGEQGVSSERDDQGLRFADPEGLEHELLVLDVPDAPLVAKHPEIPAEAPATGFQPLPGPRGVADDLKKLPGVSGAVEKQLNDLGVFHYSQFAELSAADAEKIGEEVGLPARVAGWVAKAKEFVAE